MSARELLRRDLVGRTPAVQTGLTEMAALEGVWKSFDERPVLEGLAEGDFGFTGHAFNSDGWFYSGVVSASTSSGMWKSWEKVGSGPTLKSWR